MQTFTSFPLSLYLPERVCDKAIKILEVAGLSAPASAESQPVIGTLLEFGRTYTFNIENYGLGDFEGKTQRLFALVVAYDTASPSNMESITRFGGKSLRFHCAYPSSGKDTFVKRIDLVPATQGRPSSDVLTIQTMLVESDRFSFHQIPEEIVKQIQTLPLYQGLKRDRTLEKRLSDWKSYLNVELRQVIRKQFEIAYEGFRDVSKPDDEEVVVEFVLTKRVEPDTARKLQALDSNEVLYIAPKSVLDTGDTQEEMFWATGSVNVKGDELGRIIKIKDNKLLVALANNNVQRNRFIASGDWTFESRGVLVYWAFGDIRRLKTQEEALSKLIVGDMANPRLGDFLFDATRSGLPASVPSIRPDEFLNPKIVHNPAQRQAVEAALAAPDLFLIWGPPGTGKTTVIAELCYQFAKRNQRVLLASQANLAVDNALSRFGHHQDMLVMRVGNVDRVEEEGIAFTADHVIRRWFEQTAKNTHGELLNLRHRTASFLSFCRDGMGRLQQYATMLYDTNHAISTLRDKVTTATTHEANSISELRAKEILLLELRDQQRTLESTAQQFLANPEAAAVTSEKILPLVRQIPAFTAYIAAVSEAFALFREWQFDVDGMGRSLVTSQEFDRLTTRQINSEFFRESWLSLASLLRIGQAIQPLIQETARKLPDDVQYLGEALQSVEHYENLLQQVTALDVLERIQDQLDNLQIAAQLNARFVENLPMFEETRPNSIGVLSNLVEAHERTCINLAAYFECEKQVYIAHLEQLSGKNAPDNMGAILDLRNKLTFELKSAEQHWDSLQNGLAEVAQRYRNVIPLAFDAEMMHRLQDNVGRLRQKIAEWQDVIAPEVLLQDLEKFISKEKSKAEQRLPALKNQLATAQHNVKIAHRELENWEQHLVEEGQWWEAQWICVPSQLRGKFASENIQSSRFIQLVIDTASSEDWLQFAADQQQNLRPLQTLLETWYQRLQQHDALDEEAIRQLYIRNVNVLGVTCGQVRQAWKHSKREGQPPYFDVVIIDEVSKATPPELLMPMLYGKKIILVGDFRQLPPMINKETLQDVAQDLGVDASDLQHIQQSLFEVLYAGAPDPIKVQLVKQFRMTDTIRRAINQFYDGKLQGGHTRSHGFNGFGLNNSLVWVDVSQPNAIEEKVGTSYRNAAEIREIMQLLRQMNQEWTRVVSHEGRKQIGIITFYEGQLKELQNAVGDAETNFPALEIRLGTVDRFQGMERAVVIVSLVRNNAHGDLGFAKSPERINVAFSRAQELLIVVGSKAHFTQNARTTKATEIYGRVAAIALESETH